MNKERLKRIGRFLNDRIVVHRNVENDTPWTTEEKMIQELYDNCLDLLIQSRKLDQALDEIEKYMINYIKVEDKNENVKVEFNELLKIIQKAKGDVKSESNNI